MLREDDKKIFIFRESATLKGKPTKGRRTFVVIVPMGYDYVYIGVARCCEKDQFNRRIGVAVARGRALKKMQDECFTKNGYAYNLGLRFSDSHSELLKGIWKCLQNTIPHPFRWDTAKGLRPPIPRAVAPITPAPEIPVIPAATPVVPLSQDFPVASMADDDIPF